MRNAIDMAREAGAIHIHGKPKEFALVGNDSIKAFEALVRADEREACWRLCDALWIEGKDAHDCREAIRARSGDQK